MAAPDIRPKFPQDYRDPQLRRFAALPGTFPQTKRYAAELTAGTGHDRFDFTIGLMIDGLAYR